MSSGIGLPGMLPASSGGGRPRDAVAPDKALRRMGFGGEQEPAPSLPLPQSQSSFGAPVPPRALQSFCAEAPSPLPLPGPSAAERQAARASPVLDGDACWLAFTKEKDIDEDLEECIAAWQDCGQVKAGLEYAGSKVRAASPCVPGPQVMRPVVAVSGGATSSTAVPLGPVLVLNVGGVLFRTTAATLRKVPFFDSMLRHTQEGSLGTTLDPDGHLFVDRSGELFQHVLEYLRSGHWLLGDKARDLEFIEMLQEEAQFYGVDASKDARLPVPRVPEYVTVWQFREDTSLYVDCLEHTVREDPDHQGLFRLCKYSGGLPLDQQTCTKRFKATSHSVQAVMAYFAMRGFTLQHVLQNSMITHTTSADGQSRSGVGTQYILSRLAAFPHPAAQPGGAPGG